MPGFQQDPDEVIKRPEKGGIRQRDITLAQIEKREKDTEGRTQTKSNRSARNRVANMMLTR